MASIILPPGSAPANPSEGELYYDNTAKQVKFRDNAGFKALGTADLQGEPHIITKKLFPAYLGKLLDDTTSHSGDYGTEQADGRMYYYTHIAGSKPINDPRIGVQFGSQRHMFKSIQQLEQETATHGDDVFSIDGREWVRAVGGVQIDYGASGTRIQYNDTSAYVEIVGYFNDANVVMWTKSDREVEWSLDGGSLSSNNYGSTTATTPLQNRYVDAGSVVNFGLSASLGIHTLKIQRQGSGGSSYIHGCELIAQDTTSSSTKVQIQVPAQDVVSYGRKFSVSATAQHYDPFNGFSSGDATALEAKVNTATSLGLAKWLHSGSYYRPYNGMRVVKWIDENGAIKTSVTCMPPNAKSIGDSSTVDSGNSAANAKANASVANDTFYPTFEAHTTSVNEDNLHEVAKTFHFCEFGNGAANGGTGATYADASMLTTSSDDISYCMDDGLSCLTGNNVKTTGVDMLYRYDGTSYHHITFIGTGIAKFGGQSGTDAANATLAQNLPFGTHILQHALTSGSTTNSDIRVDGVLVKGAVTDDHLALQEISIYQPKRPPIPDSACVLADYMVFADFKPQTTAGTHLISKGVRRQNISRDVFFDETDGDSFTVELDPGKSSGFGIYLSGNADSDTSMKMRIPSFGTNFVQRGFQSRSRVDLFIGDTNNGSNATDDPTASHGSYAHLTSDLTLGVHQFGANAVQDTNGNTEAFDIVTPIHTSHHYQPFETPFLHELIGGDRSMEQTNLICSSDGRSWDEITRNMSYISKLKVNCQETDSTTYSTTVVFTDWRGKADYPGASRNFGNKDFAIAYDKIICLVEGKYEISMTTSCNDDSETNYLLVKVNGLEALTLRVRYQKSSYSGTTYVDLKRGDTIQVLGEWGAYGTHEYENFSIVRL